MRAVWTLGAGLLVLSVLAGCTPSRGPSGPFSGPGGGMDRPPGEESFSQVLAIRTDRGCDAAIPPLRRFAAYGGGFEIAQFQLGDCLLEAVRDMPAGAERNAMLAEAEDILLRAANSNEPNAQGLLSELYFRGALLERNMVEAAKWLLLYQRNNLRINLGARALPSGLEADMRRTLSNADWDAARAAADAFEVMVQPTTAPPEREDPRQAPPPGMGGSGERRGPLPQR